MDNKVCYKQGISPQIWGSTFWKTFHFTALSYPSKDSDEVRENYKNFFINFFKVLPCSACCSDANKMFNIEDGDGKSLLSKKSLEKIFSKRSNDEGDKVRQDLVNWTCLFHNKVNEKLGKDIFDCSKLTIESLSDKKQTNNHIYNYIYLIIIILAILLLTIIFKNYT